MRLSRRVLSKIVEINLFSTIYLNFITVPFSKAIRFPILIFGKVTIKNVRKGRLVYDCPLITGILQVGKNSLGILDKHNCCIIWNVAANSIISYNINKEYVVASGSGVLK